MFKTDPIKKLNKIYDAKLKEAMMAQRNGDIKSYSQLTVEAEVIHNKIKKIESTQVNPNN
jgi:hypothetical protein